MRRRGGRDGHIELVRVQLALAYNPLMGFLRALYAVEELAVESRKLAYDLKLHCGRGSAIEGRNKIYPFPDSEFVPVHSFDPLRPYTPPPKHMAPTGTS